MPEVEPPSQYERLRESILEELQARTALAELPFEPATLDSSPPPSPTKSTTASTSAGRRMGIAHQVHRWTEPEECLVCGRMAYELSAGGATRDVERHRREVHGVSDQPAPP